MQQFHLKVNKNDLSLSSCTKFPRSIPPLKKKILETFMSLSRYKKVPMLLQRLSDYLLIAFNCQEKCIYDKITPIIWKQIFGVMYLK